MEHLGQVEIVHVERSNSADPAPISNRSFTAFYDSAHAEIAGALSLALASAELGRDATDEAFTRAFQRWDEVGAMQNPSGWIYRVGLNWARSRLRRRRLHERHRALFSQDASYWQTPADIDLWRAVARLPQDHRDVVVLRIVLDWSVEETAEVLAIAQGTVKSRLARAMKRLHDSLADDTEGS